MRKVLIWIFSFVATAVAAQPSALVGKVQSAADGTPIEMATVRLFSYSSHEGVTDSTLIQGVQTDLQGEFVLQHIAQGRYRLIVSSVGYNSVIQNVNVSGANEAQKLPTISLRENIQVLGTVDVKGQAAEMTVKGDTIEYNTSSYKMQEGTMVEDLLKKMNGVQVDKEGNVTVNGESIKGVRIDGKKFFGNDVQSATKNIPADMIDKVQVIDQKSDLAKLTGFEDDETERIINLSLKKDRRKGVFGNFGGGLGADFVTDDGKWFNYGSQEFGASSAERAQHFFENDFRYNANLFTNILLGNSQTTIIGGANNTNQIRSGRGRGFFGQQNQGITWAENLGVNTNIDLTSQLHNAKPNASLVLGGDAQLNHSLNDTYSATDKTSFSKGVTYQNADTTSLRTRSWDARLRLEIEYKLDSLNTLLFKPNISYTNSRSTEHNDYNYRNDSAQINNSDQDRWTNQDNISASLSTIYSHKFLKPGRSLTFNIDLGLSDNRTDSRTDAYDYLKDSVTVDQNTQSKNSTYNYGIKASYVEPVWKTNHLLEIVLAVSGNNRRNTKNQYLGSDQQHLDSAFSNTFYNDFFSEALELNYRWLEQKSDLSVGVRLNPSQTLTQTTYLDTEETVRNMHNVWNFSPTVNFKYKFGRREFARIIYRGTTQQPSITQMEPVRNNSNSMNVTVGNLDLNPAFQHSLRFMYSRFNQEKFSSLMCGLTGTLTKDALVNNSVYDEAGKLYQQTVNAKELPWNIGADLMFNLPFAKKMMQFHSRTAVNYNSQLAYISTSHTAREMAAWIAQGTMDLGDLSRTNNLRVQENLNLRFTHDIVDLGLRADFTYSYSDNTMRSNSESHVFEWSLTGDVEFHLPKNWSLAADCGYTDRYGYRLSDVSEWILNASISKSWKNASLKLSAFDLLNQKKNIRQVVGENYVQYQKFNTLPTYAMLTFTYKLNKMGDLKATGKAGFMQQMIESGGEPGKGPRPGSMPPGPPPGPPPGM